LAYVDAAAAFLRASARHDPDHPDDLQEALLALEPAVPESFAAVGLTETRFGPWLRSKARLWTFGP